jgi:hydrogenase maturation protease
VTLLVLGVGRPDRGDDAAGWLVAQRLDGQPDVIARQVTADPAAWLTDPWWDRADEVVVVDAVVTGAAVGTVHRWSPHVLPRETWTAGGTHDLGVAATLALAAALDRLPGRLEIVGIEGSRFGIGEQPSAAVVRAAARVAWGLQGRVAAASEAPAGRTARPDHRSGGCPCAWVRSGGSRRSTPRPRARRSPSAPRPGACRRC